MLISRLIVSYDQDGPHSSAIIVGRRTVVACAHSLGLLIDDSTKNTRAKTQYKYLEDYWIQPSFTRNIKGEYTSDNRIYLKLFKFNVDNYWALFYRSDNQFFDSIDRHVSSLSSLKSFGTHGSYRFTLPYVAEDRDNKI